LLLLISRKLVLTFKFQFEFDLFQFGGEFLILLVKKTNSCSLSVDGAMQLLQDELIFVSSKNQYRDHRVADVYSQSRKTPKPNSISFCHLGTKLLPPPNLAAKSPDPWYVP